ncbi:serine/threonine-protein kinase [Photobacterium alginatilyticum]|uniref:Serine/threonine protein kinase n=1 Tax=Photobacterium alginatilyticum TaxID=1775171 RepID=A0ABW9YDR2_9GAMM|nr:serine/threonine-protein kinase [Photobacterium alginatilyticum]NBI51912.1 serine/threonine protein kinase [Photobacterium alginatilyticum]
MESNLSTTELFYHLLDLTEEEQQHYLSELKCEDPELYHKIQPLLQADSQKNGHLTELFGFHAQQAVSDDACFSQLLIDKYKIQEEIGRGGMGIVYAAARCDDTFDQQLAVKFIQPSLTRVLGKAFLFQEAQLLARLNHPYVAKVFDGGEHQDYVYIVMEKVEGRTLREVLDSKPLSLHQKLKLFVKICQAIAHAHQNQTLHADIKPENVLIDDDLAPKVLDFNITQKQQLSTSDSTPFLAFSEEFASPEQKKGDYLTNQSDIFSLGKLLHFMVGQQPAHTDLRLVMDKATQHHANQRYTSVIELMADIECILTKRPINQKTHLPLYVVRKLIQRRPLSSALSLSLLVCAISFSAALLQKNHQLEREKAIAENMMFEVTSLLFHSKGDVNKYMSVQNMLELTRRRILSNPDLPKHIKQKMLLAMMTPVPDKTRVAEGCHPNCPQITTEGKVQ